MAITYQGAHTAKAIATGTDTTANIDTSAADLIVVVKVWKTTEPTLSDSQTNTWNQVATYTANIAHLTMYYAIAPSTSATHNFTLSNGTVQDSIIVSCYTGAHLTAPEDSPNHNGLADIFQTAMATGSITPSQDNCLIVGAVYHDTDSVTNNTSMTETDDLDGGSDISICMAYKIQTTAAAINTTFTGTAQSTYMGVIIASFKPAAVASNPAGSEFIKPTSTIVSPGFFG